MFEKLPFCGEESPLLHNLTTTYKMLDTMKPQHRSAKTQCIRTDRRMDAHFATLKLPSTATLKEARQAYHRLASNSHPDKISNPFGKARMAKRLDELDKAWTAIQTHFKIDPEEVRREYYLSDQELYYLAKREQEYRREQPRGAIRVRPSDYMFPGLYEEYERVRMRNLGYIFDGEGTVTRDAATGRDTITGKGIMFKNTIFTRSVCFEPLIESRQRIVHAGYLQFARPPPIVYGHNTVATFQDDTIFCEAVEFHHPAVFEGQVEFKKGAVFLQAVTFYKEPIAPEDGVVVHREVKKLWM